MNVQRLDNLRHPIPAASLDALQSESLATALSRTLHDEPNLVYMVPDSDARRIMSPSFFLSAVRAGQLFGEIHTTENADGVAVWIHPEHVLPFRRMVWSAMFAFPFAQGWEFSMRYTKLGASIEEVRKRLASGPHWYLLLLGAAEFLSEKEI